MKCSALRKLTWGLEYDVTRRAMVNRVALTPRNCRVECQSATTAAVRATAGIAGKPIIGFLRSIASVKAGKYNESRHGISGHEDLDHPLRGTPEATCCLRGYLPSRCAETPQGRHTVLRVIPFHRQPSRHPLPAQCTTPLTSSGVRPCTEHQYRPGNTRGSPEATAQH